MTFMTGHSTNHDICFGETYGWYVERISEALEFRFWTFSVLEFHSQNEQNSVLDALEFLYLFSLFSNQGQQFNRGGLL